jgi:pyridoxal biosynthesis lyase PdxS
MPQVRQPSNVSGLKSEILAAKNADQATVADRANAANLVALDMIIDANSRSSGESSFLIDARSLRNLSDEIKEMEQVIQGKSPQSN